ncbi:RagB/SusD family nutrient uptake outer membrane protein [Sphingobacterium faecium]|uniref:RagB/SusD family nutrient uptake outer membrane protein n=1 Tax=Sphingobacterium faecium TaxID=34087 RepID=UPI002469A0C2|nr:RagB/SusD family nutrient uptake outer membrane protein [Sphingobacterium faecium]MDH5826348.1 RagB/SusD family nutrient uptake outer membrane protein [Sphingobacterium faecium]
MKKILKMMGFAGILTAMTSSCNTMDPILTKEFTDATFWESTANAELMVNMAYNQMYSADKMWNDEALSDNIYEGRSATDQRLIRNGLANPTTPRFASEWSDAYGGLKTCHVFLANMDRVPDGSEEWKKRKSAEIRFIRAYIYFRLVNFFGDVPFFTSDITLSESENINRTPKATILAFIHDELSEISAMLPSRNDLAQADRGRITKGAAMAFQARAYLYESNWQKTADYCDSLMQKQETYGNYALFNSYEGLFEPVNEYNVEVILDYAYVPGKKQWSKLYDAAPLSAGARVNAYAPLQSLANNYLTIKGLSISSDPSYSENNPYVNRDPRMAATIVFHGGHWTDFDGTTRTIYTKPGTGSNDTEKADEYISASANSSPTGYYVKKYYDPSVTQDYNSGLNIIMFRYADVLLMYAEAQQQLGKMEANVWDRTIRPIRERAKFKEATALNYPTGMNSADFTTLIRNERRSELALEGLRYYDIVRWKAAKTYLDGTVSGAKFANGNNDYIRLDNRRFDENRDYLWSVPSAQMDLNKNLLPNNPGYAN